MSLVLTKTITVRRYPVIAQLSILRNRDDVAKLIGWMKRSPQDVPDRLRSFLEREKLWRGNQCTQKGEEVFSSKKMLVSERGLYHIWYCYNDALLGTRPIFLQRDTAFEEPKLDIFLSGMQAKKSAFSKHNTSFSMPILERGCTAEKVEMLELCSLFPEVIGKSTEEASLSCTWRLSSASSDISVSGTLRLVHIEKGMVHKKKTNEYRYQQHFQEGGEHWNPIMKHLLQDKGIWRSKQQRLEVAHKSLGTHKQEIIQSFCAPQQQFPKPQLPDVGEFATASVNTVPMMPVKKEAHLWQNDWVVAFYRQGFQAKSKAMAEQAKWLHHEAIHNCNLSILSAEEMMRICRKEKEWEAFWQIAAMEDLNPSDLKLKREAFTLTERDFSVGEFWHRMGNGEEIKGLLYSDRYAGSRGKEGSKGDNQSNLELLLDYYPHIPVQVYSEESFLSMRDSWKHFSISRKDPETHPRYWAVRTQKNIFYWSCDNSLTYIQRVEDRLQVKGVTTFTPILESRIPKYLKDAMQQFQHVEDAS